MTGRYAVNTSVSTQRSRMEIEAILARYGADSFGYMTSRDDDGADLALIVFRIAHRNVRLTLRLPDRSDEEFRMTPGRRRTRNDEAAYRAWEQGCRQSWRALALVIKAKLEAVESGISTVEREFMADVIMPDGMTIGEHVTGRIEQAYTKNKSIPLLPAKL